LIGALSIDTKVEFVGPISNERVPEIMRAVDVLTFPSTTGGAEVEGLPNTILESMACGLPIVATNVCGVPEVISNRETGLLVTPGSVEEMSDGIIALENSVEYREELGWKARDYITRHHTITSVAKKYSALYQRLADTHS
jgi:glycosyltransferase involved in cell wall biosynthesis